MKKIVLITCILALGLLLSMTLINHASAQDPAVAVAEQLEVWTVCPGDTLWSIANSHRGQMDVRKYIYQIQKLNNIKSTIYPGQELLLPPGK